uniref:Uncharacterized protein n=1 Tax=Arundo donax TaxID=35708 RepID=A0A0A9HR07_ARUDO
MFVAFGAAGSDERNFSMSIRRRESQTTFPIFRTPGQPAIGQFGGFLVLI